MSQSQPLVCLCLHRLYSQGRRHSPRQVIPLKASPTSTLFLNCTTSATFAAKRWPVFNDDKLLFRCVSISSNGLWSVYNLLKFDGSTHITFLDLMSVGDSRFGSNILFYAILNNSHKSFHSSIIYALINCDEDAYWPDNLSLLSKPNSTTTQLNLNLTQP